jgi:hypothetical protein
MRVAIVSDLTDSNLTRPIAPVADMAKRPDKG